VIDYVLDTSALILALGGKTEAADKLRARLPGMRCHAPHLIDAEVGNVLRRHERAGLLSPAEAHTALLATRTLVHHRYRQSRALADQAWELICSDLLSRGQDKAPPGWFPGGACLWFW
jgi:predicted nucleic acid-binding protein